MAVLGVTKWVMIGQLSHDISCVVTYFARLDKACKYAMVVLGFEDRARGKG